MARKPNPKPAAKAANVPSSSPIAGLAGLPSGGAAPRQGSRVMPRRLGGPAGRAHEAAGRGGAHAMQVPGMPASQGGTHNKPGFTNSAGAVPTTTPEPHRGPGDPAAPTHPRTANGPGLPDARPGTPPQHNALPVPDAGQPQGRVPNNPYGETTVPGDSARRRLY